MSYLNRDQYLRRQLRAEERNERNSITAEVNGATPEQAEAISDLCSLRHRMHSNIDHLTSDSELMERELDEMEARLVSCGLPSLISKYDDWDDYETPWARFDIIATMMPDDGEEYDYDDIYCHCYDQWSDLNSRIESYLRDRDAEWGTAFAPSGFTRLF